MTAAIVATLGVNYNALPGSRVVPVNVLLGSVNAVGVVGNGDGLVVSNKGALTKVGHAAGPPDGALGIAWPAGDPRAQFDLHGCLRVCTAVVCLGRSDGPDGCAVDVPRDSVLGPLDRILVEVGRGAHHGVILAAVVRCGVAFAIVV